MSFSLFIIIILTPIHSCGIALIFGVGTKPRQAYLQENNHIPHKSKSDLYDVWVTNTYFLKQVIVYYKKNDGVKWYEEGGDFESDEE